MRAALLEEVGGPLVVREVADPEGPVVTVRAAGVSFADGLMRRGNYPQMPELPFIPGSEIAGELDGERVIAFLSGDGGGYAERAVVDPEWVFPLPDGASFAEGASSLVSFLTAWIPLTHQVGTLEGRTVLVHAAAGGVGTAAVQLARHLGARVLGTASTEDKRSFVRELGADDAFAYEDFTEAGRVDVVIDPVGGELFSRSLGALNPLGTIVAIGYAGGPWKDVSPQLIVGRNVSVAGLYLGRLMRLDPALVRRAAGEVLGLWKEGAIRPVVGGEYPLNRATDALDRLESRGSMGRLVVVP
jgi:NADPH2:quinone reductase